jgi:hypothetical protein
MDTEDANATRAIDPATKLKPPAANDKRNHHKTVTVA